MIYKNSSIYKTKNNWVCKAFVTAVARKQLNLCVCIFTNTFMLLSNDVMKSMLNLFFDKFSNYRLVDYYKLDAISRSSLEVMYQYYIDKKDE